MARPKVDLGKQLALACRLMPTMRGKVERGMAAWRHGHHAEAAAGQVYEQAHLSADGNNWLLAAVPENGHVRVYMLMWWNRHGSVDALQVVSEGRAFHYYGHLFSQYRQRLTGARDVVFNLHQYFKYNYRLKLMYLNTVHDGKRAVAGVVPQGLVLGTVNGPDLISCRTYIPRDQLNVRKAALHDLLLAHDGDHLPTTHSADLEGMDV